jgi:type IV conjugative transfer system protein TraE
MNFINTKSTLASALKHRDLALWCCLGLIVANIGLSLKVLNSEEHWVLMPQYDEEHRLEVSRSKYSDAYFIDWATTILNTMLCVNPDSIDWKISQILKISRKNYGPLKDQLTNEAKKIKQDQVSTVFYPSSYKINQAKNTIEVTGEHSAYFGKDSVPVITSKKFRLTWAMRGYGVILLEDFKEIIDETSSHETNS